MIEYNPPQLPHSLVTDQNCLIARTFARCAVCCICWCLDLTCKNIDFFAKFDLINNLLLNIFFSFLRLNWQMYHQSIDNKYDNKYICHDSNYWQKNFSRVFSALNNLNTHIFILTESIKWELNGMLDWILIIQNWQKMTMVQIFLLIRPLYSENLKSLYYES